MPGTLSSWGIYSSRERVCDKGGLLGLYERSNGTIGYRCPAEPVNAYVLKGGSIEDTNGRGCLCNGLFSTAGVNDNVKESPIITIGDDLSFLPRLIKNVDDSYTAADAIKYLLNEQ